MVWLAVTDTCGGRGEGVGVVESGGEGVLGHPH